MNGERYEPPALEVLGSLSALTLEGKPCFTDDGESGSIGNCSGMS